MVEVLCAFTSLLFSPLPLSHLDALIVLLEHGAILSLKNAEGKTPLDCAQSNTMINFIQEYQEKGSAVFPKYKQVVRTTEGVSIRSYPSERRGSQSAAKVCAGRCWPCVHTV